ncbi:MAG: alpha-2-macroglobulin family protein [Gemmataceae bacterium]
MTLALTAAALAWGFAGPTTTSSSGPGTTLFRRTEPAKNPVTLQLQADGRQVIGWVSGTDSFADRRVAFKLNGKTSTVAVGKDNTFRWPYRVERATTVEVQVEDGERKPALAGTLLLEPPPAAPGPCVFLIVDRTAYRPGQRLQFAGFLRQLDGAGEFVPVAGKEVQVDLTSERKQTRAARLKLTSDDHGRIAGSYPFTDADALDHYTLTVAGFKGTARVLLGEYRKSKVRVKIDGTVTGDRLKLSFAALDFLDKPVPIAKASFAAQVVRRTKERTFTLKTEDFVYHEPKPLPLPDVESLSEEDLLLAEADGVSGQTFPGLGNVALANLSGEPKPDGERPATHTVDLKPEWRRGDCSLVVQGVITDTNGREQRASATIPIDESAATEGQKTLELSLPRQRFLVREPIEVKATGQAAGKGGTLVVMKLAFQTPSATITSMGGFYDPYSGRLPAYRSAAWRSRMRTLDVAPSENPERVRRTLVTAVPFAGSVARVALREAGAYKLIAMMPREDGTTIQQETTVVVKRPEDVPALALRLDRDEFSADDRLTGVIRSRFTDARVLLTVRDSTGIRLTKPITLRGGSARIDEPLPAGLRYGCTVDVTYPEDAEQASVAHTFARVVPQDRMLTVDVKTPQTVRPGETVEVDLAVNRKEPVDLVVSVYDQALLGIAADRSTDIRNYFLADARAAGKLDAALLHRRLGGLRVTPLIEKAQELLKRKSGGDSPGRQIEQQALTTLVSDYQSRYLYARDIATLLRLAGVDIYYVPFRYGTNWYQQVPVGTDPRLVDLIGGQQSGWVLAPRYVGNTLLVTETHPSYVTQGYAWHPVYGWNFDAPYYGNALYSYRGVNNFYAMNQLQSQTWSYSGRAMARGDAGFAFNGPVSGNSVHSFAPEGQAVLSHMPLSGPTPLLDADGDQGHIAVRRDFSDSAYWNATVRTDEMGKAKVSVKLPDSLTNWQVVVTAVSPKMHVGSAKASFRTYKPVMVWPMLPRTFTEGDRVEVFASVHNRSDEPQRIKVRLKVENGAVLGPVEQTVDVPAKANVPVYWTFRPGQAGFTQLLMSADCPAGSDASLKRLPVVRAAAEQLVTASGTVKKNATITIPEGVDLTAARLEVTFAPSLAADMADTLNYLVDYPYGCVEQTMSRFLPAVKVAQILRQFKVQHPELEKKMPGVAAAGIKRLLELQQADGGWGWNGNGQTHEMMTPYALYGLLQAERAGYQIPNETAIQRGLQRLEVFIGQMGDAQAADRIYCMYVFTHRRDLTEPWWAWLSTQVKRKALSDYALALALEMAVLRDRRPLAKELAALLRDRAVQVGGNVYWQTAGFSRWAEDRHEITAAAMKALVAFDHTDPLIDGILGYFAATKRGDRWNSTKDTAMILFALTDYLAKSEYSPQAAKALTFTVNDGEPQKVEFADQLTRKVVLPGEKLRPGQNTLTFDTRMTGVLYRAVFRYWKAGREIAAMDSGIKVVRRFHLLDDKGTVVRELKSGDAVPRGSYVLSTVEGTHRLPDAMRYVLVENPKPGSGETVPADDNRFVAHRQQCTPHVLREDRESMTCFHHEQTPQTLSVRNVFLAELAGEFVVPPARVELMYQTEVRGHSGSFVLRVEDAGRKDAR